MVLPSNDHDDLATWLRSHGVKTHELASMLLTGDLQSLLEVSGSAYRINQTDLMLLGQARRFRAQFLPLSAGGPGNGHGPDDLYAEIHRILETVGEELGKQRVIAEPYEGLGMISGSEVLEGRILITDTARLYALKAAVAAA